MLNKRPNHLFIAFIILTLSGSLFMVTAHFIDNGKIEHFDLPIIQFIQGLETPWLTVIFKGLTWFGSAYSVIPITVSICAILFFIMHDRKQAFLFAFAIASTIILNELLKLYFKRDRPEIYRLMDIGGFSFPSGHTMMAFSLYGMIAYITWCHLKTENKRILLVTVAAIMAFSIAISRIYVGVHFPSDIVGGIAASTFWVTMVLSTFHFAQYSKK